MKSIFKLLLFYFIFIIPSLVLFAQNKQIKFDYLGIEHGLSNDYITCFAQDSLGFIWIGTSYGVNRFDGISIEKFDFDIEISRCQAQKLFVDSMGRIWITYNGGTKLFDYHDGIFKWPFSKQSDSLTILSSEELLINEDKSNNLWIGNQNGFFQIDVVTLKILDHFNIPSYQKKQINIMSQVYLHPDTLLFAIKNIYPSENKKRILIFDINNKKFHTIKGNSYSESIDFFISKKNSIWMLDGLVSKINKLELKIEKFLLSPFGVPSHYEKPIYSMLEDQLGDLWLGNYKSGLLFISVKSGKSIIFQSEIINSTTIAGNRIRALFEDKDDNIWIGTDSGINIVKRRQSQFRHYGFNHKSENSLPDGLITGIVSNQDGKIWISTFGGGVCEFDIENERFQLIPILKEIQFHPWVFSLLARKNGEVWIGSNYDGGVYRLNYNNQLISRYFHSPNDTTTLSDHLVYELYEDNNGNIWCVTSAGLNYYDSNSNKFFRIQYLSENSSTYQGVTSVYQDHDNRIWFGTTKGTIHYLEENYYADSLDIINTKLSQNKYVVEKKLTIIDIYSDSEDRLWLGTQDGLIKFDLKSEKFVNQKINNDLLGSPIYKIIPDNSGDLWLLNNHEILRYSPQTLEVSIFGYRDGWVQNQHSGFKSQYTKLLDGQIVVGGTKGITVFHPDHIVNNPNIPPVKLTGFQIFNKPVTLNENNFYHGDSILTESITISESITLNHSQNNFSFQFAALEYTSPQSNQYSYKLEGFNDDWIDNGTNNFASFTNISPGDYTLRVKGSNNDGVWNEEGTSLKITILSPWWETWWAYTFYTLIAIGLFFSIRRYELNRQKIKHELEFEHIEKEKVQEVDKMKSRFFANISHEFRTPLTLISGPVQQLISGDFRGSISEQYKMILRNCNRLLNLINQLLDLSRIESGKLKLKASPIDINELTRQLTMAFESLAKRKQIQLTIKESNDDIIAYVDRDKYEKIINNLLSNALKFTNAGGIVNVSINASQLFVDNLKKEVVVIKINDTGDGISNNHLPYIFDRFYQAEDSEEQEQGGTGIGLALAKEIVELHKGEITVQSELEKGSLFTILLPMGKDHLKPEEIVEDQIMVLEKVESEIEELISNGSDRQILKENLSSNNNLSTILIVEDNSDMRNYISNHLHLKYKIIEAENGEEGLKQARKYNPNLIVSDVMMPKMDGYRFCEKIKTDTKTSHIPVILLTAKADKSDRLEGFELGADDYLTKPFDAEELQVRIKNLIDQRQKLRELFQHNINVEPKEITVTSADENFIKRAIEIVEENMGNFQLDTTQLAKEIGIGRSHLNVKLRAITGCSTREFIRTLRLKRAAQLLKGKSGNVAEVAYAVGFNSLSHFSKIFNNHFGMLPSAYCQNMES